jgi:CheY-like chemotaxis protein
MPVLDGYEAARRIRLASPETYLVALSGWGSDDDRRRTAEAGFDEHLVKPVSPDELRKLLGRIADSGRLVTAG